MKKSTKPSLFAAAACAIVTTSALLGGCASGGNGAPSGFAPNRLGVTMRLQQPLNPGYVYSFAFDDDDDSSDGPAAIVASTTLPNGVVAGSFTVLVQYEAGQFTAYRRTEVAGGSETLERASGAFAVTPWPVTGDTISFVLNLDATTDSGVRLFRADAQRLDVNFVTANERRRDPADNSRKGYDAFGPRTASTYATLDIRTNRTYTNSSSTIGEPTGDAQTDDLSGAVNLAQLDITDFSITVERS